MFWGGVGDQPRLRKNHTAEFCRYITNTIGRNSEGHYSYKNLKFQYDSVTGLPEITGYGCASVVVSGYKEHYKDYPIAVQMQEFTENIKYISKNKDVLLGFDPHVADSVAVHSWMQYQKMGGDYFDYGNEEELIQKQDSLLINKDVSMLVAFVQENGDSLTKPENKALNRAYLNLQSSYYDPYNATVITNEQGTHVRLNLK